jgi:hypothetical protein
MMNKPLIAALLAMAALTPAQAADPDFCREHARAAVNEVRAGLSDSACGRGLQGRRWSSDFAVHYEWCLGVSAAMARNEADARARYLKRCAGR